MVVKVGLEWECRGWLAGVEGGGEKGDIVEWVK